MCSKCFWTAAEDCCTGLVQLLGTANANGSLDSLACAEFCFLFCFYIGCFFKGLYSFCFLMVLIHGFLWCFIGFSLGLG